MTIEMKAYCVHCGGGMEFPAELQGEKIICPHCNVLTTLGEAKPEPPLIPVPQIHPAQYQRGRIKTKSEFIGAGCLVQGLALLVIWIFPLGTIAGIVLLLIGSRMSLKYICSECGNPIASKSVRCCPACQTRFK